MISTAVHGWACDASTGIAIDLSRVGSPGATGSGCDDILVIRVVDDVDGDNYDMKVMTVPVERDLTDIPHSRVRA